MGEFALLDQHLAMMRTAVRDPTKWGSGPSDLDLLALEVEAAWRRDDAPSLEALARLLAQQAAEVDHGLYRAIAERGLAVARARKGEALAWRDFARAVDQFEMCRAPWQVGRTHLAWARAARELGDPGQARLQLAAAIEAFEAVGATPAAEAARAEGAALA